VQVGAFGQTSQFLFGPVHSAGNLQRVTADALGVAGRVIVAKVDCRAKCLQGVFITPLKLLESLMQLSGSVGNHFFEMLAVVFDLLLQVSLVEGALKAGNDSTLDQRLDEIVVRAGTHGLDTHFHVIDPGRDQECHVRIAAANVCKKLQAANARHLEVGYDGVKVLAVQGLKGLFAAGGGRAQEIRRTQHDGEEF
jgi:hypothetical protein